jgi:Zn-finger nucleic acid-binding protein
MKSPIDGSEMTAIEYEGALIYTCKTSGGELVGPDALSHIVNSRQQRFGPEWDALVADHEPLRGIPGGESKRRLACPCCHDEMAPVNYGTDTAVIVDRCATCGAVWLDAHELEMIQALMEAWQDHAPASIRAISFELEDARRKAAAKANDAFHASRFSFINALFNRLLDAA